MIKAIIVDDERSSRENIQALVEKFCPEVKVVGQADSAITGLALIREKDPDLIFLDIEMPQGDGFDLLESLPPNHNFQVIFITAYDQYAIRAIKFSALDYLLKPLNIFELKAAVEKVTKRTDDKRSNAKHLAYFIQNLKNPQSFTQRISLPTSKGFEFVELQSIVRCEANDCYTWFHLNIPPKKILVSKTLKDYEELLSELNFYRVHQSHLINAMHISKLMKTGGPHFIMSDGSKVPISQRRKDVLKEILKTN